MLTRRKVLSMAGVGAVALAVPSIARAQATKIMLAHATAEIHPGGQFEGLRNGDVVERRHAGSISDRCRAVIRASGTASNPLDSHLFCALDRGNCQHFAGEDHGRSTASCS